MVITNIICSAAVDIPIFDIAYSKKFYLCVTPGFSFYLGCTRTFYIKYTVCFTYAGSQARRDWLI